MVFSLYLPNIGEHFVGRSDQILEKENGHPTHQTRVLEEQTRYRLQEKSVQSEAGQFCQWRQVGRVGRVSRQP